MGARACRLRRSPCNILLTLRHREGLEQHQHQNCQGPGSCTLLQVLSAQKCVLDRRFRAAAPGPGGADLEPDPTAHCVPTAVSTVAAAPVDADDDSSDFEPDAKRRRAAAAQRGSRVERAAGAARAGTGNGVSSSGGRGGGKRRKAAAVKKPALGRVKRCSNKQVGVC